MKRSPWKVGQRLSQSEMREIAGYKKQYLPKGTFVIDTVTKTEHSNGGYAVTVQKGKYTIRWIAFFPRNKLFVSNFCVVDNVAMGERLALLEEQRQKKRNKGKYIPPTQTQDVYSPPAVKITSNSISRGGKKRLTLSDFLEG